MVEVAGDQGVNGAAAEGVWDDDGGVNGDVMGRQAGDDHGGFGARKELGLDDAVSLDEAESVWIFSSPGWIETDDAHGVRVAGFGQRPRGPLLECPREVTKVRARMVIA